MPKKSPRRSPSPKMAHKEAGKHAAVSRLINKYGADRVSIHVRPLRKKSPNAYARYVKANFKKMRKSGEKPTTVMKKIAKSWNSKERSPSPKRRKSKKARSRK